MISTWSLPSSFAAISPSNALSNVSFIAGGPHTYTLLIVSFLLMLISFWINASSHLVCLIAGFEGFSLLILRTSSKFMRFLAFVISYRPSRRGSATASYLEGNEAYNTNLKVDPLLKIGMVSGSMSPKLTLMSKATRSTKTNMPVPAVKATYVPRF